MALLNKFVIRGAWSGVVADGRLPYKDDSGHIQFFTRRRFVRLAASSGFVVASRASLSFLSGPYTN